MYKNIENIESIETSILRCKIEVFKSIFTIIICLILNAYTVYVLITQDISFMDKILNLGRTIF